MRHHTKYMRITSGKSQGRNYLNSTWHFKSIKIMMSLRNRACRNASPVNANVCQSNVSYYLYQKDVTCAGFLCERANSHGTHDFAADTDLQAPFRNVVQCKKLNLILFRAILTSL